MPENSRRNRRSNRRGSSRRARQRRTERLIVISFVLIMILCALVVMGAKRSHSNRSLDLIKLARAEFSGYDGDGVATIMLDDAAADSFFSDLKEEHDNAWLKNNEIEDGDYAKLRQSMSFTTPNGTGISNGDEISVIASCDSQLAEKLGVDIGSSTGSFVASGLKEVKHVSPDEVFSDLDVSFSGISPNITVSIANNSTNPLISKMFFEIMDAKETYAEGDTLTIRASYTDEMVDETGYKVDSPTEECLRDYTVTADSQYLSDASMLTSQIIREAIEAGKSAFTDANEYGVRIFCEANLVPVYVGKKATFRYGYPEYVSAYFKTVHPDKAGTLGLAYNDLDILYNVVLTQADGTSCPACAAVRFSDIVINSDGSYSYDFSAPSILSMSHMSSRVKKNVVDSYSDSYTIERVGP